MLCYAFFAEPKPLFSESESSDSISDTDEEDPNDYGPDGYHPVEVSRVEY